MTNALDLTEKLSLLTKQLNLTSKEHNESLDGLYVEKPMEWVEKVTNIGFRRTFVEKVICNFFSIDCRDANSFHRDSSLWFSGGVYCQVSEKYFMWELSDAIFSNKDKIGVLKGQLNISGKGSDTHANVLGLFANLERVKLTNVSHISITKRTSSIVYGRKEFPFNQFDSSQLNVKKIHSIDSSIFKGNWEEPIYNVIEHINKNKTGNLLFLCGDYTDGLADLIIEASGRLSTECFSLNHPCDGAVNIIEVDSRSGKKALQSALCDLNSYSILISRSKNITELFNLMLKFSPPETLVKTWGTHHFNIAVPKLCNECKELKNESDNLIEPLVSVTELLDSHFVSGVGCESCLNGYSGIEFIQEHLTNRTVFIQAILEVYKETGEYSENTGLKLPKTPVSPYSLASNFYHKDERHMKGSIKLALQKGTVQISDVVGLLI